jgi:hypothetical protein
MFVHSRCGSVGIRGGRCCRGQGSWHDWLRQDSCKLLGLLSTAIARGMYLSLDLDCLWQDDGQLSPVELCYRAKSRAQLMMLMHRRAMRQRRSVDIVVLVEGLALVDSDSLDLYSRCPASASPEHSSETEGQSGRIRHCRQFSLILRRKGSFGATVTSVHPCSTHQLTHSIPQFVVGQGARGDGGRGTLRDCRAKSRSMPNVCWTASHTRQHHALSDLEGRGAPYRRRIPCQRRLRRPFRRTQTATCRALAPPCQIRDVKRAKR